MNLSERIHAFVQLGHKINNLNQEEKDELYPKARAHNGWFTPESIEQAMTGISHMLSEEKLTKWTKAYKTQPEVPKIVGVIMAGNIPMVGFHDLLSVLISGHIAALKLSSQDQVLMKQLIQWIIEVEPRFKRSIDVREKLDEVEAVIATGSDNTARYFDYYFGKYPNIIRKNRTSIAVIDGTESPEELAALGKDIFQYYGLGCRNVSKLYLPEGFDLTTVFPHWETYSEVRNHNKYHNNYDYNKAILLVNRTEHLDTGFLMTQSSKDLVSPTSILYHETYTNLDALNEKLKLIEEKTQCIIGHGYIPFGKAQSPEPWDYADGVDTLTFLSELK
jgi:hypothetical protein